MEQFFNYATLIAIYAIYAMSLNLLLGYTGQLSVAQAAFGGVGGYAAAYLAALHGWAFGPALVVGVATAFALGALIALPALYLDVRYLILLTLAWSAAVAAVIGAVPELGGRIGISPLPPVLLFGGTPAVLPSQFFPLTLVSGVGVLMICWRLTKTPFGRVLRGIRDDEIATRGLGKNIVFYKVAVFGIASAMAGLAGVLLVYYLSSAEIGAFSLSESMLIVAIVVIGGTANLIGSILGAIFVVMLDPILQDTVNLNPSLSGLARLVIYGALIVFFLMVRPEGILPERFSPVAALRRLRDDGSVADLEVERSGDGAETRLVPPAPPSDAPSIAREDREPGELILESVGLTKHFGGILAADDLTIQLRRGWVIGLIGPNGAGKTTVFNLLTGLSTPDEGRITLKGQDIGGWTINRIAGAGMARTYQNVRIFPRMTVFENVGLAVPGQAGERLWHALARPLATGRGEAATRDKAMEHLRFVGLDRRADVLAGSLPLGEQKLLALARLLATEADVLLLDEPASGIDIEWIERMLEAIVRLRHANKSVCIVEHNLHVVERVADWVYFMEAGRITAQGHMRDLMRQERLAEVYFGSA